MKFTSIDPPRVFTVGVGAPIELRDCARIALAPDEQVTFVTESGAEYDVARKSWGFYATPSINGRLRQFGFRAALVEGRGKVFVLLVERGAEAGFRRYLDEERLVVVRWLADPAPIHCMCGADEFAVVHRYETPPVGETRFRGADAAYPRELRQCVRCRHFVSVPNSASDVSYDGGYVDSTYRDAGGISRAFERIVSLPDGQSDNAGRVAAILRHVSRRSSLASAPTVLDVGSGLCVFLHRMKAAGWICTALDPDERAVAHARGQVGVRAVCGDFMSFEPPGLFDLVTFNKVLEHVRDPIVMLQKAGPMTKPDGTVYVEVPDGEAAAETFDREEFFMEHDHVFSLASVALLGARAGFGVQAIERLREPSGKFTLRAFLNPIPSGDAHAA